MNNQLLSVKDIEAAIKQGHTKTAELIRTGEIETFKIGRRRMATQAALQKFIQCKLSENAGEI